MLIEPKHALRGHAPDIEKTQFPGDRSAISGLRYYSPTLGRFINKDPIEEQGGLNLYGFCGNNGVNRWDYLGMSMQYAPRSGWLLYGEQGNTQALTGGSSDNSAYYASMATPVDNGGVTVNGKEGWARMQAKEAAANGRGANITGGRIFQQDGSAKYAVVTMEDGSEVTIPVDSLSNGDQAVINNYVSGYIASSSSQNIDVSLPTVYSFSNPGNGADGSKVYYTNGTFNISDSKNPSNHVVTDGNGGFKVVTREIYPWIEGNPAIMSSIHLHEGTHIEDALASDPNIGKHFVGVPGLTLSAANPEASKATELRATIAQLRYLDAVVSLPSRQTFLTQAQMDQVRWYSLYVQKYQSRFSGTPSPTLPPVDPKW